MKAKHMALGGLLTALSIVILYLTLMIPTNTLTLLTLASFMVPVALLKANVRTGLLVYITTSLLSLMLMPPNISLLYILFFGCYGLLKYFIEKIDREWLEWLLKLACFNFAFITGFHAIQVLLGPSVFEGITVMTQKLIPNLPHGELIVLGIAGQIGFIIFDYALTLLIDLYYKYFHSL